jgi:hypothetical protein
MESGVNSIVEFFQLLVALGIWGIVIYFFYLMGKT